VKSREQREAELHLLAATEQGKWELADMTKRCLGIGERDGIPLTTLMIHVILSHEYPRGAESD
jgi:hypothetical protein